MVDIKSIPDDVKWRLAAECAASLPAMYDVAFRRVVGEQYDEIEQEIWMELSRRASGIARELSLPLANAQELAESIRTIMTVLFGPEYKGESLEISEDSSVLIVKRCPLLARGQDLRASRDRTFHKCMAFTLTAIPQLNKDFTARIVRAICMGERQCEIKIEAKKQLPEDSKQKK